MDTQKAAIARTRAVLAVFGLVAGLSGYAVFEFLPDLLEDGRLRLAISTFGLVFFSAALAMTGPLGLGRAAAGAALAGATVAALMVLASQRFDAVGPFLQTGHPLTAASVAVAVFLPFWIAARQPGTRWSDYPTLFDATWRIVLRYLVGVLFTLLVWAMIFLGDSLLGIVGIDLIGDLVAVDWVPYAISGMVFATGLAVAHEQSGTLSPYVVLRLFALVLPPLVAVTAIFLAALPFRGLSGLFGGLSSAGTLMSVSIIGIVLVSVAIDRADDVAVAAPTIRSSARIMALFLPVLGGLAVWAVAMRVVQYGWSPDRVAAMTAALASAAYGLAYAAAIVMGAGWMQHLRRANLWLALALGATGLLWLTPVIDPQRISAQHQLARFERGEVGPDEIDLWSLRSDWGRAGVDVFAVLTDPTHPRADELAPRIAQLEDAGDRRGFENGLPPASRAALIDDLIAVLLVRPDTAVIPPGSFDGTPVSDLQAWRAACGRRTAAGTPGCVAVVADFLPGEAGNEVIVLTLIESGFVRVSAIVPSRGDDPERRQSYPAELAGDFDALSLPGTLDSIAAGDFGVVPLSVNGLRAGEGTLFVLP
jgi:hypothetical protein